MQNAAPIGISDRGADAADGARPIRDMIPLTQSKMHALPTPAPEQPVLPRRSALVIEVVSFVLIAFLVVSALLFNLTAPRPQVSTPSVVSVPLPPKPVETAAAAAASPADLAPETPPAPPEEPAGSATLPEVQPQAGATEAPPVDTEAVSRPESPAEVAALPPAAAPVAQDAPTDVASEPATPPTPEPAEETASLPLPTAETQALIRRGDALLGTGDVVAARAAYERAAAGGDRAAAMGVAKTYDPIFLAQTGVRGLRGDPARAALWYTKAAAAGDPDAQQRLRRLRAQYPQ